MLIALSLIALVAPISGGAIDTTHLAVGRIVDANGAACSGTLIGPHTVLTAAHCAAAPPFTFTLSADATRTFDVRSATAHPRATAALASDLAVLELGVEVAGLAPMPLANVSVAPGASIVLVGYGRDENGQSGTRRSTTNTVATVRGSTFEIRGDANACAGDSGGPVLALDHGVLAIAGVISNGEAMCGEHSTHVRVSAYLPWLATVAADARLADGAPLPEIDTAPSVRITHPGDGAVMPDEFSIGVDTTDDFGGIAIEIAVDGAVLQTIDPDDERIPLLVAPGDHQLSASVIDATGHRATHAIAVTVEPPIVPPRADGAACWDATDCDSALCSASYTCGAEDETSGGCSVAGHDSVPGLTGALGLLALCLSRRRRRTNVSTYCG